MSYSELSNDVGPDAIGTVMIQMGRSSAPCHGRTVMSCVLLVRLPPWIVLYLVFPIGRLLSPTALYVIDRRFGLKLAAAAVEIMAEGLRQLLRVPDYAADLQQGIAPVTPCGQGAAAGSRKKWIN